MGDSENVSKNNTVKSNRILFIVHREQIAKQAMKSYKNVFGRSKTYGLLSGNSKETDADILFATMQMMSKDEVKTQFQKDCFRTIGIDEAHRTGAASYQKIMDYFEPEFWLGMTASPERTDDFDVFATFDHNIALEIRLQQAMEENLLCPFHYFGITDMEIDGVVIDEKTEMENFRFRLLFRATGPTTRTTSAAMLLRVKRLFRESRQFILMRYPRRRYTLQSIRQISATLSLSEKTTRI